MPITCKSRLAYLTYKRLIMVNNFNLNARNNRERINACATINFISYYYLINGNISLNFECNEKCNYELHKMLNQIRRLRYYYKLVEKQIDEQYRLSRDIQPDRYHGNRYHQEKESGVLRIL